MRRILFYIIVICVIPISLGLLSTYIYGLLFSNARYWETISKVQEIEISVIKNILTTDINEIVTSNNYNKFNDIFEPYYGKLYIEISKNSKSVFNNKKPKYEIKTFGADFNINTISGPLNVKIANYVHQTWNVTYLRWLLSNPLNWLSQKYDFINVPFIFFVFIWGFAGLAFAWRCRADYESKLLKEIMEALEIDKYEK
jgi:hypothetical protein